MTGAADAGDPAGRTAKAVVTGIEIIMHPITGAGKRLEEKSDASGGWAVVVVGVLGKTGTDRVNRPA